MVADIVPETSMSGRRRSRSRSPARDSYDSRNDDYSYRSDSFVSDTGSYDRRSTYTPRNKRRYDSYTNTKAGKKSTVYRGGRGKAGSKMTGGRTTNQKDYLKKRVLSAKRLKVNELNNEIEELQARVHDLVHDNRILKRESQRNEREIDRFQNQESDLPKLLASHSQEVRALRDQARKQKEKSNRADKKLRDTEDELRRTKKQLKKLEDLNNDKKLAEREELSQRLSKLERDYDEKDSRCKNLERHVENLTKNQKTELATEISKQREANKKYKEMKEQFEKLQLQMKEKEKELELHNIHSYRIMKAPHHLSTRSSPTPLPPTKNKKQRANTTSPNISPREKAKLLEDKRREDQRRAREAKNQKKEQKQPRKVIRSPSPPPSPERSPADDVPEEIKEEDSFFMTASDRENSLFAAADRRDKEEKERRKREEQEKIEKEKLNRKKAEDDKLKRERERMKRESEERARKEKEEKERQKRERLLQEEKERKEKEEAERRGREEQQRQKREEEEQREIREEQDRLRNSEAAQEERRKKDALLAKLKQIDDNKTGSPKKDSLNSSPHSNRKTYNFTQPVENMHNGKPSHDDVTVPVLERQRRKSDDIFDDDFGGGGYQPSTGRRATRNNNEQPKSDLMTSLFNTNETKKSSFGEDDIFSSSTKAKPVSDKKAYPWEKEVQTNSPTRRKNSNDLFTNTKSSNSPLLPRRPRQHATTIHTKPTVNAIDDIEDDIEEVIL